MRSPAAFIRASVCGVTLALLSVAMGYSRSRLRLSSEREAASGLNAALDSDDGPFQSYVVVVAGDAVGQLLGRPRAVGLQACLELRERPREFIDNRHVGDAGGARQRIEIDGNHLPARLDEGLAAVAVFQGHEDDVGAGDAFLVHE